MEATKTAELERAREGRWREECCREDELATLSADLAAATARWLELVWVDNAIGDEGD